MEIAATKRELVYEHQGFSAAISSSSAETSTRYGNRGYKTGIGVRASRVLGRDFLQ